MKLEELRTESRFVFEDVPCEAFGGAAVRISAGRLFGRVEADAPFELAGQGQSLPFRVLETEADKDIALALQQGYIGQAVLSRTPQKQKDGKQFFNLYIVFFLCREYLGRLQVVLNPNAKTAMEKYGIIGAGAKTDEARLEQAFTFKDGTTGEDCFAFIRTSSRKALQHEEEKSAEKQENEITEKEETDGTEGQDGITPVKDPEAKEITSKSADQQDVLQIVGRDCSLFVRLEGEGMELHAVAYRAVFDKQLTPFLQLAYGKLSFSDERSYVAMRVREILSETPGYAAIWNEYASREGDFLLQNARAGGMVTVAGQYNLDKNGIWEVPVTGIFEPKYISKGDRLNAATELPIYMLDEQMTWDKWQTWLDMPDVDEAGGCEEETAQPPQKLKARRRTRPHLPIFEFRGQKEGVLYLKPETEGVKLDIGMMLFRSIGGDERQIERRSEARRRIEEAEMQNPRLALILGSADGQQVALTGSGERRHFEPMSALVQEKVFSHPPTVNQCRAIDIALNTPDIAIIQGPPGTGKTTVITAILERLNEIADKKNMKPGQVLITSLQHDAVNNVLERIRLNSMPTIKFGGRNSEASTLPMEEAVREWSTKLAADMEARHPELRTTEEERRLYDVFKLYVLSPSADRAKTLLQTARERTHDATLLREIDILLQDLHPSAIESEPLIGLVQRLRTDAVSFADDGATAALSLYNKLENSCADDEVINTLREAAVCEGAPDAALLSRLADVRVRLLTKLVPKPFYKEENVREDVVAVYQKVKAQLQRPQDAVAGVIYDFYRELRDNPYAVQEAAQAYCFAFAATAQQSERAEIKRAKGIDYISSKDVHTHASYKTVIVDEAARVNPGDLMIPLSQAEEHIILVGDQRQLPHMYDEEIFQSLREDGRIANEGDIKTSMFEHLWGKAHALTKADGIPRAITLDAQYRMHPLLGGFVSDNFYAPYGEGFTSPRPPEDFAQPLCEKAVQWVDLSTERGKDKRNYAGSLQRECEADYIVSKVREWTVREDAGEMDFGVISFYRGQADLIKSKLKDLGKRVRVGTVDEFQGMEFDVIFLSIVRSGRSFEDIDLTELERDVSGLPEEDERVQQHKNYVTDAGRKCYGFLNDHRLCVALSRQKRLLVVVGDAAMFEGQAARTASVCVPAMLNLYRLCQSEGSVVHG